ncbi:MAG: hydantoinase B/oxoprolinase family protein [Caldilineaceae bacterium]|nr:hydantoinase B/oxoprolinase family protein [Caldilineaceae bacterium]
MDPITLELYRHRFASVSEEMGITLRRTAYSPNIKERLDFSCALFDAAGKMVAQAAHIPAHLGAMPASVATVLPLFPDWQPGDVVIVNDPFQGGNHLPDITMISPVFLRMADGEWRMADGVGQEGAQPPIPNPQSQITPSFFVASRAHHADVGGMTPGSLPLSTEIFQEGIIIPPVRLVRGGVMNEDLLRLILRNVRTPDERRGDIAAQRAAHAIGQRRLLELVDRHGADEVLAYAEHLQRYTEQLTRSAIARWPDGRFEFEDVIELVIESKAGDEVSLVPLRVAAIIAGEEITFDFSGTAVMIHGSLNTVMGVTESACYYGVRCMMEEGGDGAAPMNAGAFAPITVSAPVGCMVNAVSPAAVAGGNVETSQRIVDLVLGALAIAMPERAAAASQGTMNNVTMGGLRADGTPFAYYETIAGGMGGSAKGDGLSGAHVHMTNTLNTPVEALEVAYPLRVTQYSLRPGSGGAGAHRGGDGVVREYEALVPVTVTMLSERRAVAPWGLAGGEDGGVGRNVLIFRGKDGEMREEVLLSKFTRRLQPGDRLRIETPGGGGWGHAAQD